MVLLPVAARAGTGEPAHFAQAALVTTWSLSDAGSRLNTIRDPVRIADALPSLLGPQSTPPPASAAAPHERPEATHLADSAGPSLDRDLEARGVLPYDRQRLKRTPHDIKRLEVAFHLLNAADAATTITCLQREDCQEANPVYGKRPKPIVVIGAKTAVSAVHYWVMRSLLPDHPGVARAFGWFSVVVQGGVVGLNMSHVI